MYTPTRFMRAVSAVVVVVWLGVMSLALVPMYAKAAPINQADVDAQTTVVRTELISTMEEYVKLLQMILIVKLEARLAALQAAQH